MAMMTKLFLRISIMAAIFYSADAKGEGNMNSSADSMPPGIGDVGLSVGAGQKDARSHRVRINGSETKTTGRVMTKEFFIAPHGSDANPGTLEQPVRTPAAARNLVRTSDALGKLPVNVFFRRGRITSKTPSFSCPKTRAVPMRPSPMFPTTMKTW